MIDIAQEDIKAVTAAVFRHVQGSLKSLPDKVVGHKLYAEGLIQALVNLACQVAVSANVKKQNFFDGAADIWNGVEKQRRSPKTTLLN